MLIFCSIDLAMIAILRSVLCLKQRSTILYKLFGHTYQAGVILNELPGDSVADKLKDCILIFTSRIGPKVQQPASLGSS